MFQDFGLSKLKLMYVRSGRCYAHQFDCTIVIKLPLYLRNKLKYLLSESTKGTLIRVLAATRPRVILGVS
jgi:hypothetical protein